jgi:sugar O-acyltransferase (sialic acid O-acetyltransferase NeuD family)
MRRLDAPPVKNRKLVIVGAGRFAEVAFECFEADSPYEVAGFAVERPFLREDRLLGRPVVVFEDLGRTFPPDVHEVYVAVTYTELNRLRTRLLDAAKRAGYRPATYVSTDALVWRNVEVGEHCFVLAGVVVDPHATIGSNVILWSGSRIGHHSRVRDNVFLSIGAVVAGLCDIGPNAFIGANAVVITNVAVAKDCWIGPSATVLRDTAEGEFIRAPKSEPGSRTAPQFFGFEG